MPKVNEALELQKPRNDLHNCAGIALDKLRVGQVGFGACALDAGETGGDIDWRQERRPADREVARPGL